MKLHDAMPAVPDFVEDIRRWFYHYEQHQWVVVWDTVTQRAMYAGRNPDGTADKYTHACGSTWAEEARVHPHWEEKADLIIR